MTRPPADHDGEQPLGHREMLTLAEETAADAADHLEPDDRLIYAIWGAAWTLGYAGLWITSGDDPLIDQRSAASWLHNGLILVAIVATIAHLANRFAGLRGPSEVLGRRVGATWVLAFGTLNALVLGLDRAGAAVEVLSMVAAVGSVSIVGTLYAIGGAVWDDALQFRLGVWILLVAAVGGVVGDPHHFGVLGLGGGGGFLVAASVAFARERR